MQKAQGAGKEHPAVRGPQSVRHKVRPRANSVVKLSDAVERVLFIPAGSESQNQNRKDDSKLRRSASVSGHHYAYEENVLCLRVALRGCGREGW